MSENSESYSTLGVRMEESLKEDFMNLAKEMGLSAGTLVNSLAKVVQNQRRVPFEISLGDSGGEAGIATVRHSPSGSAGSPDMREFSEIRKRIIRTLKTFGISETDGVAEAVFPLRSSDKGEEVRFILDWENEGNLKVRDRILADGGAAEPEAEYIAQAAENGAGSAYMALSGGNFPKPVSFEEFRNAIVSILDRLEYAEVSLKLVDIFGFLHRSGIAQLPKRTGENGEKETVRRFRAGGADYEFEWPAGKRFRAFSITRTGPEGEAISRNRYAISEEDGKYRFRRWNDGREAVSGEVDVHDCIRALTEAAGAVRRDIRERNEVFELAKKKAEELIGKWNEAFLGQGTLRKKEDDGGETRGIVCRGEDCNVAAVIVSESPDLEYVYMGQVCFDNPEPYPEEEMGENDRFCVEAGFPDNQRPLLAVRSKTAGSDEWPAGLFTYPDGAVRAVSEAEIGSFPGWLADRKRLKDGSFKDQPLVDIEAVSSRKFRALLEEEVRSLGEDLIGGNRKHLPNGNFGDGVRDSLLKKLEKEAWPTHE